MRIILWLRDKYMRHRDTVKYWKNKGATIGNQCEIYSTANFGSEPYLISIGNHVRINAGVQLITHDGGVWVLRNKDILDASKLDLFGKIIIGNNVHIGTNAIIMPGVHIGDNCIIGCGAVVTKDIPDNSIVVGVPARVIESIDDFYEKHKSEFDYTKEMSLKEKREYLNKKYNV